MVVARLQSLAANQTTAVPVVKAAVRAYRASESSARDLISTIWNVLDQNLEYTASIVNAFVDLLEQEQKKQDLLASWKGFVIEVGPYILISMSVVFTQTTFSIFSNASSSPISSQRLLALAGQRSHQAEY